MNVCFKLVLTLKSYFLQNVKPKTAVSVYKHVWSSLYAKNKRSPRSSDLAKFVTINEGVGTASNQLEKYLNEDGVLCVFLLNHNIIR